MSTTSKIVFGTASLISVVIITYVHYKQQLDRWVKILYCATISFYIMIFCSVKLHEGVIKDVERQQRRKMENLYNLQQQIDLTKQLQSEYNSTKDNVT